MTKRTKRGQAKHDKSVLRSAEWYESKGYGVAADLPGYKKPKTIGGFRPDIIAKKSKKEFVIEVETKQISKRDEKQHKAFSDYAQKSRRRDFRKKVI